MSKQDYYDVLGLAKNASDEDIKQAYRKMASKYHPDKVTDEAEKKTVEVKFKEAKEAYEILSDTEKRATYDSYGHDGLDPNRFAHGNRTHSQTWNFEDVADIQSVFNDLFGAHTGFTRHARPQQQIFVITLTLKEAYSGRTVMNDKDTIIIPRGIRSGSRLYVNGKLYQIDVLQDAKFKRSLDDLMVEINITAVEAMLGIEATLEHLDGTKFQFSIPAGIQTGQIVKLSKMGMKNPEVETFGDLMVRVGVSIPKNLSDAEKTALKSFQHRVSINI